MKRGLSIKNIFPEESNSRRDDVDGVKTCVVNVYEATHRRPATRSIAGSWCGRPSLSWARRETEQHDVPIKTRTAIFAVTMFSFIFHMEHTVVNPNLVLAFKSGTTFDFHLGHAFNSNPELGYKPGSVPNFGVGSGSRLYSPTPFQF
ncbi:hypothetical protein EVAR_99317_1 [Eumeta japonica]|uniref:Uncharacterized protein n=1 Tax=Eumeta variegata TaxID=151549 RepID=A0A4C1YYC5_EUMVA|nr:hypothetical protein EVAR_99317_1 [Eumeta japonica]